MSQDIGIELLDAFRDGHRPWWPMLAALLMLCVLGAAAWRHGDRALRWMFAAAVVLLFGSYAAALTPETPLDLVLPNFGGRYAYAPTVLLGLVLLGLALRGSRASRGIAAICLCWVLIIGALNYDRDDSWMPQGPSWQAEVRAWHADPARPLSLWPSRYQIFLTPHSPASQRSAVR